MALENQIRDNPMLRKIACHSIIAFFFVTLFMIPGVGRAGGLYLNEFGTPSMGVAGAGANALANDASTSFHNPAGMTRLEKSELLVGIQPLYLHAEFSPDPNTTTSGSDGDASTWLPAGGLYYVHNLMPKLKVGISAVGYFGLGLEYENDWVEPVGSKLEQ